MADEANTTHSHESGIAPAKDNWQAIGDVARRVIAKAQERRKPTEAAE